MDAEASGPAPLHGDLISFAAWVMEPNLTRFFDSGDMRPTCDKFSQSAYDAIGMTREQHLNAPYSKEERILAFADWLGEIEEEERAKKEAKIRARGEEPRVDRIGFVMVSDNPGFDFQWLNFELLNYTGKQLLGHSARRIGDVWAGLRKRPLETMSWKKFRVAPHDHTPKNDALGNAEAWNTMWERYG